MAQMPEQTNLYSVNKQDPKWSVTLSEDWDILGPFPIHAREQQFLSPSYPIANLSQPIDFEKVWPSSYADNAFVRWSKTQLSCDGIITVAFPEIRWRNLRATEGWAALQHHALLRGTLTVIPPSTMDSQTEAPRILVRLIQGSYFTILPVDVEKRKSLTPQWYAGDIYKMERALSRIINLPTPPDPINVTQYNIFISGDYEIRLFGDPHIHNTEIPTQVIGLSVQMESMHHMSIQHESSQDVLCDFVDGFAFGDIIGIGFRSAIWTTVTHVTSEHPEVELRLKKLTRIAPSQLRVVPLIIAQHRAFRGNSLNIVITIVDGSGQEVQVPVSLPIAQRNGAVSQNRLKATYLFGTSMPTSFLAIPPIFQPRSINPPILALHGAGVDIIEQTFWPDALPPSNLSWTIIPSGRTSWGLDWHGPSALDAWNSVDALSNILVRFSNWKTTAFKPGTPVIIIGHSNGGQGTWHMSTRHPDRVLGIVPASGYIKSQAYIPLTMSRSAHYVDPALRAILETSLTPDDEDLFVTNVMNKPVLVVHGGDDDNVPVWHGRELFSVVKTWTEIHGITSKITMKEDKGEPHFYPTVLNNSRVQEFILSLLDSQDDKFKIFEPFTLTVFRPEESGSLNGWRIEQVNVLGRLARLTAVSSSTPGIIEVNTNNVKAFSISGLQSFSALSIDGNEISIDSVAEEPLRFERQSPSEWKLSVPPIRNPVPSPPTRIQSFLASKGPITFVLPTQIKNQPDNFVSLGFRLAHDLHVYHRIDSEIVQQHEVTSEAGVKWPENNFVVVGRLDNLLIRDILAQARTPIGIEGNNLTLNGHAIRTDSHTGAIFLHPHPIYPEAIMMVIIGESAAVLERAARLFPTRTGITVPSWIILGSEMDRLGAAGVSGAGIWGPAWTWNDAFSWSRFL